MPNSKPDGVGGRQLWSKNGLTIATVQPLILNYICARYEMKYINIANTAKDVNKTSNKFYKNTRQRCATEFEDDRSNLD